MALKLSHNTHDRTLSGFPLHLSTSECVDKLMKKHGMCWSYTTMLLFFKYNQQRECTSLVPGCFNPYNFDYLPYYYHRVYRYGINYLVDNGYIKRVKSGSYQFTALGNSVYNSFVSFMDHKTRSQRTPEPTK